MSLISIEKLLLIFTFTVFISKLVVAQNLALVMDEECKKLALHQIIGNAVFWKVSLKKDVKFKMEIFDASTSERMSSTSEVELKFSDPPNYFGIACYKLHGQYSVKYAYYRKNTLIVGDIIELPVRDSESLVFQSVPQSIQITDKVKGEINLYDVMLDAIVMPPINEKQSTYNVTLDFAKKDTPKYRIKLCIDYNVDKPYKVFPNTELREGK
jgi:hypothetical protein